MKTYGKFSDFLSLRAALEHDLREHLFAVKSHSDASKRYRFEHCLRVAAIGRRVAEQAELDAELLEIGCLLHDIGKWDAQKPVDHGRAGALIVKPLLLKYGLDTHDVHEVAQGIAMHTDGLSNPRTDKDGTKKDARHRPYLTFNAEPSVLARSIGDCDNIDRYSVYRIVDTVEHFSFLRLTSAEQKSWLRHYLDTLKELRRYHCATEAAQHLWIANVAFQEQCFRKLLAEVTAGTERAGELS